MFLVMVLVIVLVACVLYLANTVHIDAIPLDIRLRLFWGNRNKDIFTSNNYVFIRGKLSCAVQLSLKFLGIIVLIGLFYGMAHIFNSFKSPFLVNITQVILIALGGLMFFPFKAIRALYYIKKDNIKFYPPINPHPYFSYVSMRITDAHIHKWNKERKMAIPAFFIGAGYMAFLYIYL